MTCGELVLSCEVEKNMGLPQRNNWSARVLRRWHGSPASALLLTFLIPARLALAIAVPPKPDNHFLDQGAVFPAEDAREIAEALKKCAREQDVHIYVLAVPTLKVMPSRVEATLEELLKATREAWLKDEVGALIIFDDESGHATMAASEKAITEFFPVAINVLLQDPRLQSKAKRSAAAKLADTVTLLVEGFTGLRTRQKVEERKSEVAQVVFASIAGGAVLLGSAAFALRKRTRLRVERQRTGIHLPG